MQRNCCHVSFAFILKFLNFLQAFVGISIIIYSIWMLDQWNRQIPVYPPTPPPSPLAPTPTPTPTPFQTSGSSSLRHLFNSESGAVRVSDRVNPLRFAVGVVSVLDKDLGSDLNSFELPAPWFIYSFMGVGILLCCISFIGFIAAESINGCCLCFYSMISITLFLAEAALVAFIAIDHRWEKVFPFDPTGELESLQSFIEDNIDLCKWVGITVVIVQALALLMAIILRAMVSTWRSDTDDEDEYVNTRGRTREPLLNSQASQMSGDSRGAHSDIWSSRMREKYGLNNSAEKFNV